MSEKKKVQEWAIQDEATGEYWGWDDGVGWHAAGAYRYSYDKALLAATEVIRGREGARIVPAPLREIPDAECWRWFHDAGLNKLELRPAKTNKGDTWYVSERDTETRSGEAIAGDAIAYSETFNPCDAIRAARRKIEGGK